MTVCSCEWLTVMETEERLSVCPQVESDTVCSPVWSPVNSALSLYIQTLLRWWRLTVSKSYVQSSHCISKLILPKCTHSQLLLSYRAWWASLRTFSSEHLSLDILMQNTEVLYVEISCAVQSCRYQQLESRVDVDISSPRTQTISLLFITSTLRYHFQIPKEDNNGKTLMKCRVKVI